MSDALDRVLAVLDSGVQSSYEAGFGTDVAPDKCARCLTHERAVDGELCVGCRAFLLEDSETDPRFGDCAECRPITERAAMRAAVRAPLPVGTVVTIGGRRAVIVDESTTAVLINGRTYPVEWGDVSAEMASAQQRLRAALALTSDEVQRLIESMVRTARETAYSFEQLADAVLSATAACRDSLVASGLLPGERCECEPGDAPRVSLARERELDLLVERRRSHRRTNRLGPRPGR